MTRSVRFTRQADESLARTAAWTAETFGVRQAESYERELLDRCAAIADGMRTVGTVRLLHRRVGGCPGHAPESTS